MSPGPKDTSDAALNERSNEEAQKKISSGKSLPIAYRFPHVQKQ